MPELPDLTIYLEALQSRIVGRVLQGVRLASPFVLRTATPPIDTAAGRRVAGLRRVGKRIVIELEGALFLVVHLMVLGRLRWLPVGAKGGKSALALFDFANGTLALVESGSKRRASLHVVEGEAALAALDPGGVEPLEADKPRFAAQLRRENHMVKRALTDPKLFAGIGNAYSDEILHRAQVSPFRLTQQLTDAEVVRLYDATRQVLMEWTRWLRNETGTGFPEKVTAFREGMAVHGRYGQPCPVCGSPVQRIVYAENETNYCARCQTGGRILADRAMSRLLHDSFPRNIDEL
ncbi:MAG TPA: DNA-formamidopyrimidine glycosylase family protein [Xanthomonadales bacterium]|nr:DNA-formamidopyrimidine glycosylase family protein [Xanthomonadales bacterium]